VGWGSIVSGEGEVRVTSVLLRPREALCGQTKKREKREGAGEKEDADTR
jgi:hypothetical protein